MKQMGAASRRKLNIALLILLLVALVVLAAVLFVRAKPDAVSPDNRIETAEPLSLTLPRTALSAIFNDAASPQTGGYSAVPLTGDLSLPNSQLTMDVNEQLLPGDTWTETFDVNARFRGTATIRFTAALKDDPELPRSDLDVQKEDKPEKLSSQLSMTVKQGDTVIYSGGLAGLADEVGKGVTTSVPGSSPAKVPYTVILKLNEEADNRYQGRRFSLLLTWQLDDTGGGGGGGGGGTIIVKPPKTGDDFSPFLMGGAALVSLSLLAVLVLRRRKGEHHD